MRRGTRARTERLHAPSNRWPVRRGRDKVDGCRNIGWQQVAVWSTVRNDARCVVHVLIIARVEQLLRLRELRSEVGEKGNVTQPPSGCWRAVDGPSTQGGRPGESHHWVSRARHVGRELRESAQLRRWKPRSVRRVRAPCLSSCAVHTQVSPGRTRRGGQPRARRAGNGQGKKGVCSECASIMHGPTRCVVRAMITGSEWVVRTRVGPRSVGEEAGA